MFVMVAACVPLAAPGQQARAESSAAGGSISVQNAAQGLAAGENPFLGSVPQGQPSPTPIPLTILDALDRGLKYNLGLLLTSEGNLAARGARIRELSVLLPNVQTRTGEVVQQSNLAAFGIPLQPGMTSIVGPFSVFDTRTTMTQNVLDFPALYRTRMAGENVRAAQFNYLNARDLVVLAVGGSYLQAVAGASRVQTAEVQFKTARAVYEQAVDLKSAGMVPAIDVLRAQVEMQAQQQRLLVAQNSYSKSLLALARTIGLPLGQQFTLADPMPPPKPVPVTLEEAFIRAFDNRPDYKRAQSLTKAAEFSRKAAAGEGLPSVGVSADYGVLGRAPGSSHGTFTTSAAVRIPIFQGGRVQGDVMQADAVLNQRRAELEDLRSRVEYEVRTAFLDVESATQQLEVATSALDVARQQVVQSRDRFAAGVTNNLELVQAQEAQSTAEENYIASLFAHNFAKLNLARAMGIAEDATKRFLGGK